MCHHEQTELRDAQTSSGKRRVISLCDPTRRRAHGETNAITAFVQLRKVSPPHIAVLSRLRLCTTALCAETANSRDAENLVASRLGRGQQKRHQPYTAAFRIFARCTG